MQHMNAAGEGESPRGNMVESSSTSPWLFSPAETPGEVELPVPPAWELCLALYILMLCWWGKGEGGFEAKH